MTPEPIFLNCSHPCDHARQARRPSLVCLQSGVSDSRIPELHPILLRRSIL